MARSEPFSDFAGRTAPVLAGLGAVAAAAAFGVGWLVQAALGMPTVVGLVPALLAVGAEVAALVFGVIGLRGRARRRSLVGLAIAAVCVGPVALLTVRHPSVALFIG